MDELVTIDSILAQIAQIEATTKALVEVRDTEIRRLKRENEQLRLSAAINKRTIEDMQRARRPKTTSGPDGAISYE